MRHRALAIALALAAVACGDSDPTAIRVVAELHGIQPDQLRLEVASTGERLLATYSPEAPAGALESPVEVYLIFDDAVGDRAVELTVEALQGTEVVASATTQAPIVVGRTVRVPLALGEAADCDDCPEDESGGSGGGGCTPRTCESEGACATTIDDGCGATLDCGGCAAPDTCGGGGVANQCGCTPTCESKECGDDGCGGDCGACGLSASNGHQMVCEDHLCRVPNNAPCNPYFELCQLGWECINWICQPQL